VLEQDFPTRTDIRVSLAILGRGLHAITLADCSLHHRKLSVVSEKLLPSGIPAEESDEQFENAEGSIRDSFEPVSYVTLERF
jgi:hypothetical protein